jgi:hypothetical protein
MTTSDEMSTNRVLCGGDLLGYNPTRHGEEPLELPANA